MILTEVNESNIQSPYNQNTSLSILQKNTNTGSNNTVFEKKNKRRIKDVPPKKYGIPVLENVVATENVVKQSEGEVKKVITVSGDSVIKNLNSREIWTILSITSSQLPIKNRICWSYIQVLMIMERILIQEKKKMMSKLLFQIRSSKRTANAKKLLMTATKIENLLHCVYLGNHKGSSLLAKNSASYVNLKVS